MFKDRLDVHMALKGAKKLNLSVHSVGRIPGGYMTNHIYTWVDPQGRSVSPPTGLPHHQSNSLRKDGEKRSHLQLLQEGDEKKVSPAKPGEMHVGRHQARGTPSTLQTRLVNKGAGGGSSQCLPKLHRVGILIEIRSPPWVFSREPQVNLVLDEGRSLGLMIRGGAEYSLGIYITGVDKGSEAESTGLKVRSSNPPS
ncbi:Whirlin [Varanus komodoensis]|nr:Whirlin [Varanus komodoensis]